MMELVKVHNLRLLPFCKYRVESIGCIKPRGRQGDLLDRKLVNDEVWRMMMAPDKEVCDEDTT